MRGVFLDLDSLDRGDLELDRLQATLPQWQLYPATRPGETASRIKDAQVVISNKVVLDEKLLAQAPQLKLIAVAATGTNNVDLEAARERGIAVCNVRDYAAPSVVQHVFSLILALTRHLNDYQRAICDGRWQQSGQFCLLDYPIRELGGLALGIIGYGNLGRAVAHTAESAFGMQVLVGQRPGAPPQADRVPLERLLERADILTLHCPLAANTRNLIGTRELALMKPDALLINAARGGIVDEAALADALRRGIIGGAGIDCFIAEPPDESQPLMAPDIPNLIRTPHIAWASREARQRLLDQLVENIQAFTAGQPRNLVG